MSAQNSNANAVNGASDYQHGGGPSIGVVNPRAERTAALLELWRTFPKDTTVGNEHDRLWAAMGHVYDAVKGES